MRRSAQFCGSPLLRKSYLQKSRGRCLHRQGNKGEEPCYDHRMDRQTTAEHLAQAERHVAEGRHVIEIQQNIIAGLERVGHDSAQARKLLGTLQETQAMHLGERDRLQRELTAARS